MTQLTLWNALLLVICIAEAVTAFYADRWAHAQADGEDSLLPALTTLALFVPAVVVILIDNDAWLSFAAIMGSACAGALFQQFWAEYQAHREWRAELRSGDPERVLAAGRALRARSE